MGILWMIIIGFIVGALAKLIMPGKDPGGFVITTVLGIVGALLAGFVGRAAGWYSSAGSGPGIIASILGAIGILAIYRVVTGRRASTV
jgi:uncharacterized membrane protein YeaQ/YmgE (transglycosylase-associated protein family)